MARRRIGIWLIGARGGVASTTAVGLAALGKGLIDTTGLVSTLPQFAGLDLAGWNDLVVAGHDIRRVPLFDEAMRMYRDSRAIDPALVESCRDVLEEIDSRIVPGTMVNVGSTIERLADDQMQRVVETPREAIRRVQDDFRHFVDSADLDGLVVVNVASTEPPVDPDALPPRWADLDEMLDSADECPLAASSLYAIAALEAGFAYVNFTPSLGSSAPAICELAEERGTCHMGRDGKTGETLIKSVLAPMFARRNFRVMSWVGHNIFGNMDGVVLDDPANKESKVKSKDRLLGEIFGYQPQTLFSIEYIRSLGDWKTAWDHIHFQGFLGTPMTMQFTWQGCDSLLAAPLVIDLVRFTERARRAGQTGVLGFLASFFKSPLDVDQPAFAAQFELLEQWAAELSTGAAPCRQEARPPDVPTG